MSKSVNLTENNPFLRAILDEIGSQDYLSYGNRWLLAVSGGADSMAMLDSLAKLQKPLGLEALHVAHLNHRLRESESDADADFVKNQACHRDLAVTIEAVNVAEVARETGESLETAARDSRYRFFAQTAKSQNCQVIVLAHNADDQAETILHRILRGTGLRGLAGIPPARPLKCDKDEFQIIRPLLSVPRSEIHGYLKRHRIPWREDSSNATNQFTRNRLRNELLPLLREQFNPNASEALRQLGAIAEWTQSHLTAESEGLLQACIQNQDQTSLQLNAAVMAQLPPIQQMLVFEEALALLNAPRRHIGFKQLTSLRHLLTRPDQSASLQLPGNLTACRLNETVTLKRILAKEADIQLKQKELQLPGSTPIGEGYIVYDAKSAKERPIASLHAQIVEIDPSELYARFTTKPTTEEYLDLDKVNGNVILRARREGDRFHPLGASGDKTLGDFLTDAKVPLPCRDRLALISDEKGIIWVCSQRLAHRIRVTQSTSHILKLSYQAAP
jgi:tRNA(Ile)-lysidine synthase